MYNNSSKNEAYHRLFLLEAASIGSEKPVHRSSVQVIGGPYRRRVWIETQGVMDDICCTVIATVSGACLQKIYIRNERPARMLAMIKNRYNFRSKRRLRPLGDKKDK